MTLCHMFTNIFHDVAKSHCLAFAICKVRGACGRQLWCVRYYGVEECGMIYAIPSACPVGIIPCNETHHVERKLLPRTYKRWHADADPREDWLVITDDREWEVFEKSELHELGDPTL